MVTQKENRTVENTIVSSLGYPIVVRDDVRADVGAFLTARYRRWVILCDVQPDVLRLARSIARRTLGCIGVLPFALGERRKRLSTLEAILDQMLRVGVDRETCVLGVGGGIANDLFGFAAAIYMRGVGYVHVATTLVAMVDAAIGAKTGVDLLGGKNLAGVFRDPKGVFSHVGALQTLPYREIRSGLAEVVKSAIIEGGTFFEMVETLSPHTFWRWPWHEVIAESIKVKVAIVADDKHEAGIRQLLNLGHTFAHGLERASEYRIAHGAGVALGLRAAGLLALRTGRFSRDEHLRVLALIALLGMPLRTSLAPNTVLNAMQSDKKMRKGKLQFVVPRAIGDVEYGVAASDRTVRDILIQLQKTPQGLG